MSANTLIESLTWHSKVSSVYMFQLWIQTYGCKYPTWSVEIVNPTLKRIYMNIQFYTYMNQEPARVQIKSVFEFYDRQLVANLT